MIPVGQPPAVWPSLEQAEAALDELLKAPRFGGQCAPLAVLDAFFSALRAKADDPVTPLVRQQAEYLETAYQVGFSTLDDSGDLLICSLSSLFDFVNEVKS